MSIMTRADHSKILTVVGRRERNLAQGLRTAGAHLAFAFSEVMTRIAPRDTRRYVAGWQQAANDVMRDGGVPTRTVERVVPSRRYEEYLRQLGRQVENIQAQIVWRQRRIKKWYDDQGRAYTPWVGREHAKIRTLERRLRRALEELAKAYDDPSILYFGGQLADAGRLHRAKGRQVSTVRNKRYGGVGSLRITLNGRDASVSIALVCKEPHAFIVQKRYKIRSLAAREVKRTGGLQAASKLFETLVK